MILSLASRCQYGYWDIKLIGQTRTRCPSVSRCPSGRWGNVARWVAFPNPQVQSRRVSAWLTMHTVAGRDDQSASWFSTCLHDPDCHYETCPMCSELPFDCQLPPTHPQCLLAAHLWPPSVNSIHRTPLSMHATQNCYTFSQWILLSLLSTCDGNKSWFDVVRTTVKPNVNWTGLIEEKATRIVLF